MVAGLEVKRALLLPVCATTTPEPSTLSAKVSLNTAGSSLPCTATSPLRHHTLLLLLANRVPCLLTTHCLHPR